MSGSRISYHFLLSYLLFYLRCLILQFGLSSCPDLDGYILYLIVLYVSSLPFDDQSISKKNAEVQDSFWPEPVPWEVSCTPCSTCFPWFFASKIISLISFFDSFYSSLTFFPQILSPSYAKRHIASLYLIWDVLSILIDHLERRNTSKLGYNNSSWTSFHRLVPPYSFGDYSSLSNFSTIDFANNCTSFVFVPSNS